MYFLFVDLRFRYKWNEIKYHMYIYFLLNLGILQFTELIVFLSEIPQFTWYYHYWSWSFRGVIGPEVHLSSCFRYLVSWNDLLWKWNWSSSKKGWRGKIYLSHFSQICIKLYYGQYFLNINISTSKQYCGNENKISTNQILIIETRSLLTSTRSTVN